MRSVLFTIYLISTPLFAKPTKVEINPSKLANTQDRNAWFNTVSSLTADNLLVIGNQTFELGKELGSGDDGKVFLLRQKSPPQVIKVAFGPYATSHLLEEASALKTLTKLGIPCSKILQISPDGSFLIKEYIDGETVETWMNRYGDQTNRDHVTRLVKLVKFFSLLEANNLNLLDLHSGNLMFDPITQEWKIIDPGLLEEGFEPPKYLWSDPHYKHYIRYQIAHYVTTQYASILKDQADLEKTLGIYLENLTSSVFETYLSEVKNNSSSPNILFAYNEELAKKVIKEKEAKLPPPLIPKICEYLHKAGNQRSLR